LTLDSFQKDLVREMDTFHFKGKWKGSGSGINHLPNCEKQGVIILTIAKTNA